jgi:indolepyruvate ferredoxin oxidoreductase alpha subunit
LGAGHPWNALDTCISMGASISMAIGMDKGRQPADAGQRIVAVIGDSTFLHMGMAPLVDAVYNRANLTVLLLDNRAVGMTGGQDHPGTGRDLRGNEAPRVDFAALVAALGVEPEHIAVVDPYELPTLFKTLRREVAYPGPSVIITNQPCVLTDRYRRRTPYQVLNERCTGCGNCLEVGCPAIHVRERGSAVKPSGKTVELAFVTIDTVACTGCGLCLQPCAPDAIVPAEPLRHTVITRDQATAAVKEEQ